MSTGVMEERALATAYFVKFHDQIFDSLNGVQKKDKHGKPFKCCISKNSPHIEFWNDAVSVIEGFKYTDKDGKTIRPWSQDGWLVTLKALIILWDLLSSMRFEVPILYLATRYISQDPLENLFSLVRSNCGNNHTPNTVQFVGSLKTCIVNGLAYADINRGSNCQSDDMGLLSNLQTLLSNKSDQPETVFDKNNIEESVSKSVLPEEYDLTNLPTDLSATAYVSEFIARRLLNNNTSSNC